MFQALKGCYLLVLHLPEDRAIRIGKLGTFEFKAGYYAYVGSGMNGLEHRVRRHFLPTKKRHWHIDFLLDRAKPLEAVLFPSEERKECELNEFMQLMPGSEPVIDGFGSSDCYCASHLHRLSCETLSILRRTFASLPWLRR